MREYGHLYKRVEGFDFGKCAYCGESREALDHAPAITLLENINVKTYRKKGGKLLLYPSCGECNKLLGACKAVTYYERLEVLEHKYSRKLNKIEVWEEDELEEMGHTLRAYIEGNQYKLDLYNTKLTEIHERMFKIQIGELTEDGFELNPSSTVTYRN